MWFASQVTLHLLIMAHDIFFQHAYTVQENVLSCREKEEDAEIIVNRVEEVMDAVTIPILRKRNHKGKTFVLLFEDIKQGLLREEFEQSACKEYFTKFSTFHQSWGNTKRYQTFNTNQSAAR